MRRKRRKAIELVTIVIIILGKHALRPNIM